MQASSVGVSQVILQQLAVVCIMIECLRGEEALGQPYRLTGDDAIVGRGDPPKVAVGPVGVAGLMTVASRNQLRPPSTNAFQLSALVKSKPVRSCQRRMPKGADDWAGAFDGENLIVTERTYDRLHFYVASDLTPVLTTRSFCLTKSRTTNFVLRVPRH